MLLNDEFSNDVLPYEALAKALADAAAAARQQADWERHAAEEAVRAAEARRARAEERQRAKAEETRQVSFTGLAQRFGWQPLSEACTRDPGPTLRDFCSSARDGEDARDDVRAHRYVGLSGPAGAVQRPSHFPQEIFSPWRFCMGAQGVY